MSQRIFFVDEDNVTFVNYGSGSDYTYRREARIHNASRGLQRSRRATRRTTELETPSLARRRQLPPALPSVDLENPLSGRARGLSIDDFNVQPRAIESLWRSAFQDYFRLPHLDTTVPNLSNPAEAFLAAARASPYAYRNLVTLTVVTSEARRGASMSEPVFRNQAQHIQEYRRLVDRYNRKPDGSVTRQEFQDLFMAGFSFFGRDFGREPAYNAIVFTNSTLMSTPASYSTNQLPTVEWMRMLLPRPGCTFVRTQRYQSLMLGKVNSLLGFMERVQDDAFGALTVPPTPQFHPETAICKVLGSNLQDSNTPEPFPGFYLSCLHRVLFLLHTYISELDPGQLSAPVEDGFLGLLESVASTCLQHEPRQRIALFLWGILVHAESQAKCRDISEQFYTWAMKDLYALFGLDFVPAMVSWLFHRTGHTDVTPAIAVDIAELRLRLRAHYEPDRITEET